MNYISMKSQENPSYGKIGIITYEGNNKISEEIKELTSIMELNTFLEGVKQYNTEHKDTDKRYQQIIHY